MAADFGDAGGRDHWRVHRGAHRQESEPVLHSRYYYGRQRGDHDRVLSSAALVSGGGIQEADYPFPGSSLHWLMAPHFWEDRKISILSAVIITTNEWVFIGVGDAPQTPSLGRR